MKKLFFALLGCMMGMMTMAQPVDFSTYERVIKRGNVTVVSHNDECRLIVGSLKKPRVALPLGYTQDGAVEQLELLLQLDRKKDTYNRPTLVSLFGIRFSSTISGLKSNRVFYFRGLDDPVRFKLATNDITEMKRAIMESRN